LIDIVDLIKCDVVQKLINLLIVFLKEFNPNNIQLKELKGNNSAEYEKFVILYKILAFENMKVIVRFSNRT